LPRFIGRSDAMLMLLTGNRSNAAEALRIGLVSKVLPQAQLLAEAEAIAQTIAANAPLSVRAVKRMVLKGEDMPLEQAIETERLAFGLLYSSEDRIEGRLAFAEKRKPQFKGR
jgi:E-phenylitaconyl-CoA hydratase